MRRPLILTLIVLVLAPLAGCGGGDSSHPRWEEAADAICRASEEATASLSARLERLARTGIRTPRERSAAAAIIDQGIPHLKGEIAELRHLRTPPGLAQVAAGLFQGLRLKRGIGEELARGFEKGSAAKINRALLRLERNEEEAQRFADRAGLKVCGRSGEALGRER
jgi:hypothetical protein